MKKALAILLTAIMLITVFSSCADTPPPPMEEESPKPALTVYVSATGDDTIADGTKEKPYLTLTVATEYVLSLGDKYSGADIILTEGEYTISSPLTIENSAFPVRFAGEGNAVINGDGSDCILYINCNNVTLENLTLKGCGISACGDYLTVINCDISSVTGEYAIKAVGSNITITNNHIYDCANNALLVDGGDMETLARSATKIHNNYIHDYGTSGNTGAMAIGAYGVDVTGSHNEIASSVGLAIEYRGAYITIEYNYIHDVLSSGESLGAIMSTGVAQVGNIIRYNHIKNIGNISDGANALSTGVGSSAIKLEDAASYYEIYGNIIETVAGNGIRTDSRSAVIRNNLIIDCSNWYVWNITLNYAKYFKHSEIDGIITVPDYVYSPVWKEANPDLSLVVTDLNQTTLRDPYAWAAPTNTVIEGNWIHFNKAIRVFTQWGASPYSIEDTIYTFSEDTVDVKYGSRENANMSVYNSRRDPVVIEELLQTSGGIVDMDADRFATIGRVTEQ